MSEIRQHTGCVFCLTVAQLVLVAFNVRRLTKRVAQPLNALLSVLCLLLVLLCGCRGPGYFQSTPDYYYLNPNKDLSTIGRVALFELANDTAFLQISADVTDALFQAVQKKQVFGLIVINQHNPAFQSLQLDSNAEYTFEQLSTIRKTLNCDAVLIGTVTGYKPYPHMIIGLRLKLIDLADGQILWALEQIWDTTDKTTENRIKSYYSNRDFMGSTTLREKLVTISSLRFVKFVAYEIAETL
jgi:hypothetical protein